MCTDLPMLIWQNVAKKGDSLLKKIAYILMIVHWEELPPMNIKLNINLSVSDTYPLIFKSWALNCSFKWIFSNSVFIKIEA